MPQALLITGPDAAGKTAIGQAIGTILTGSHRPTAVIDLDWLSQFGPRPDEGSPFYARLRARNLAALWTTYREAGAQYVIVTGVIESDQLCKTYADCLTDCAIQTVRLLAPRTIRESRRAGLGPDPSIDVTADITVTNTGVLEDAAHEVIHRTGW